MKKLINILLILILSLQTTGCFKSDTMEDITIYSTVYPIEFVTEQLYGDYAEIKSIYPDGVITEEYVLTKKQIKDYSDSELFIFIGLNKEKDYVKEFFKYNKNIKIIDATSSMEILNRTEELWLNPSNLLMLAQNIKNGFNEYVKNHYIKQTIENNYEELKLEISKLDANISLLKENATNNNLIVTDDLFLYLSKFGFNIISLDEDTATEKTYSTAKQLLLDGTCEYIISPVNEELTDNVNTIVKETEAEILEFHTLTNISETERNNKKDYLSLMNDNIELLKNELYK